MKVEEKIAWFVALPIIVVSCWALWAEFHYSTPIYKSATLVGKNIANTQGTTTVHSDGKNTTVHTTSSTTKYHLFIRVGGTVEDWTVQAAQYFDAKEGCGMMCAYHRGWLTGIEYRTNCVVQESSAALEK